jgi:hypothetical protein
MGKYWSPGGSADAPIQSPGCKDLPGGYVNDTVGKGCWAITGQTVIIGDKADSVMKGMECCNWNFRVDGTQPCCPNKYFLPGTAVV